MLENSESYAEDFKKSQIHPEIKAATDFKQKVV